MLYLFQYVFYTFRVILTFLDYLICRLDSSKNVISKFINLLISIKY